MEERVLKLQGTNWVAFRQQAAAEQAQQPEENIPELDGLAKAI